MIPCLFSKYQFITGCHSSHKSCISPQLVSKNPALMWLQNSDQQMYHPTLQNKQIHNINQKWLCLHRLECPCFDWLYCLYPEYDQIQDKTHQQDTQVHLKTAIHCYLPETPDGFSTIHAHCVRFVFRLFLTKAMVSLHLLIEVVKHWYLIW